MTFEGRIRQIDQRLPSIETQEIKRVVEAAAISTRPEWSEDNAKALETQVAEKPTTPIYKGNTEVLGAIGAKIVGGVFEDRIDTLVDAFKEGADLGVPLGFVGAFVDAVIGESVKEKISDLFKERMIAWLSRHEDFASTIDKLRDSASKLVRTSQSFVDSRRLPEISKRIGMVRNQKVDQASSEDNDVDKFEAAVFPRYWSGFSKIWSEAAERLPEGMRIPASDLLKSIELKLGSLPAQQRSEMLAELEKVWIAPAQRDSLSYISAMVRCEAIALDDKRDFADGIADKLIDVLMGSLASDQAELGRMTSIFIGKANEATRAAEANAMRLEKSARAEHHDWGREEIAKKFLDARRDMVGKAGIPRAKAFVALSQADYPLKAREGLVSALSSACILKWTVTTWIVINGVRMNPPTVTHTTTSCF
jgi:hypothetical protein